jgi:hypothetical protein
MRDWDIKRAINNSKIHCDLLNEELNKAKSTVKILDLWSKNKNEKTNVNIYNYNEASELIGTTKEAIRNWERNKLIDIPYPERGKTMNVFLLIMKYKD